MIYPHQRYKNVEIASIDLDKKVLSLIVHYDGEEADLLTEETQAVLSHDISEAIEDLKSKRFFEDDPMDCWRYPAVVMIHPPIKHE